MAHIDRGRCDMRIMVRSILSKGAIRLEILALLELSKLVVVAIIECGGTRELPFFFFQLFFVPLISMVMSISSKMSYKC